MTGDRLSSPAAGIAVPELVLAALVARRPRLRPPQPAKAAPSEVIFLAQLVILMLVGRLLGEAMQRIGQPSVMGQLLAGILLGPSVLGALLARPAARALSRAPRSRRRCSTRISQFGILLLLLLTGMETDLKLVQQGRPRRDQHLAHRRRRAVRLRLRARPVAAGIAAAAIPTSG